MILNLLRHREKLFTEHYRKIIYFVPEKHLYNPRQAPFMMELKKACPTIILKSGFPDHHDIRSDSMPKLMILGNFLINSTRAFLFGIL